MPAAFAPLHGQGALSAAVETILQNVYDAIFATDTENRITFWTRSAEQLFGYTSGEALGGYFTDILPSEIAAPSSEADLLEHMAAGATWHGEGTVRLANGNKLWLESTVSPIIIDGQLAGSVSVSRDKTATHKANHELAERARLFQALNKYTTLANAIHDEDQLSPALLQAVQAVIPADYVVLTLLDPASGRYLIRAAHGAEGVVGTEIHVNEGSSGRAIAARTLVVVDRLSRGSFGPAVRAAIADELTATAAMPLIHDGIVLGAITVARTWKPGVTFSAAEREALALFGSHAALAVGNVRLLAEVRELAVHDGLTGLYNRRHFDASLDLLLARRRRTGPAEPVAAIMFDLDRFGKLNRDHGHQAGDAVLRAFGGILHERLRSSDLVARYGGEEFVAILERTALADAVAVAETIRSALDQRAIVGPDQVNLHATVSAGVAMLDPTEPTPEALLRAADVGLFLAKRAGRNRVVVA